MNSNFSKKSLKQWKKQNVNYSKTPVNRNSLLLQNRYRPLSFFSHRMIKKCFLAGKRILVVKIRNSNKGKVTQNINIYLKSMVLVYRCFKCAI